jgi:hypothetical protein
VKASLFSDEKHWCKACHDGVTPQPLTDTVEAPKNGPKHGPSLADFAQEQFDKQPAKPIEPETTEGKPIEETLEEKETIVTMTIDWKEVKRERDAGAKVADLAKKYKCSAFTIYKNADTSGKAYGNSPTGKLPDRKPLSSLPGAVAEKANSLYSVLLSATGMDAIWAGLAPEKKAELLKGL